MERSLLAQQLAEVREDLRRAKALFGDHPISPPSDIAPDESVVKRWIR